MNEIFHCFYALFFIIYVSMKTLKLKFDHFHLSGDLIPGFQMLKDVHFELLKPNNTIEIVVRAPLIRSLRLEFRLDGFEEGILKLFILSKRGTIDTLLSIAERFIQLPEYIRIDYPFMYVDIQLLSRKLFPGVHITNMTINDEHYQISLELP
jgi:hypothetical protein